MPLDQSQSAPGSRITTSDGTEADITARIASDAGPLVVLNDADGKFLSIESEGNLRDNEDTSYVGTTAEAKQEAYAKQEEEDRKQADEDRQARIKSRADAEAAKHAAPPESAPVPQSEPTTPTTGDTTGATGATGPAEA